jgi:hypothetical protein
MRTAVRQPVRQHLEEYVVRNDDGTWGSAVYRYIRTLRMPTDDDHGLGEFIDKHGGICEIPFARLRKLEVASDKPDPVEAAETRRYRQRSRETARQRGGRKRTAAQHRYIISLMNQRGLSLDQVRALTPRSSLSDLTTQEASRLIDRLKGGRRA